VHVLAEVAPNHANLDNADKISLHVIQHVNACNIGGTKRDNVQIIAKRMLDEELHIVMQDVPTKQFDFSVKQAEANVDAPRQKIINAFDILIACASSAST